MGITTPIIEQTKKKLLIIKEGYLDICHDAPHPHCAAGILSVFEYWTAHKRKTQSGEEHWIYKSNAELTSDMLGLFSLSKVKKNLPWLVEIGYLSRRCNPNNPWDKTYQYLFMELIIQSSVGEPIEVPTETHEEVQTNQSNGSNEPIEVPTETVRLAQVSHSLSEITTESTEAEVTIPETTESESTTREGGQTAGPADELPADPPPAVESFEDFLTKFIVICGQPSQYATVRKKAKPHALELWNNKHRIINLEYAARYVKDGHYHFSDLNFNQVVEVIDPATQMYGESQPDDTGLFDTAAGDVDTEDVSFMPRYYSRNWEPPEHPSASQSIGEGRMNYKAVWLACQGQLELQLNRGTYETWVADTKFYSFEDGTLTLCARNSYAQEWLMTRLSRSILTVYSGMAHVEDARLRVLTPKDFETTDGERKLPSESDSQHAKLISQVTS